MIRRGLLVVGLAGCGSSADPDAPQVVGATLTVDGALTGFSGLDVDERGVFWAVAERGASFVLFDPDVLEEARVMPILGVPDGMDLESVALLGDRRVAVGTESRGARAVDSVLLVEAASRTAEVTGSIPVAWTLWGFDEAPDNQGVEGLCAADGVLLMAGEPVRVEGGGRVAPIGRYDPRRDWIPYLLPLTSDEGKVSGLWCRTEEDVLEVWAIERHYGTVRLLRFEVPARGDGGALAAPVVVKDLARSFPRGSFPLGIPNLEGLVVHGGRGYMMADASGGGSNLLVEVSLR